ncbi:MAG TPA: SPOR domain-containing protein, partial [Candidatus Eisenbacteria bacterium]|nr:SPOR domain-containing protein [Candidatus Eisenbacteria bacterium]
PLPYRRPRMRGPSRGMIGALLVLAVIVFVVYYSVRGTPFWFTPESQRVPTSGPAGFVTETTVSDVPATGSGTNAPVMPAPVTPPRAATAPPEPKPDAAAEAPAPNRYGLEVATFIFEERARSERARLAEAGIRARVLTKWEYGSKVYRVVIGAYPKPGLAERAADSLLARGVVLQARVVSLR